MSLESTIKQKLQELNPTHVEIINESHMHSGPATDSHFKLVVVSTEFENVRAVARHQRLYKMFAEELQGQVHALSLFLYTPEEWQQAEVPSSPTGRGLARKTFLKPIRKQFVMQKWKSGYQLEGLPVRECLSNNRPGNL